MLSGMHHDAELPVGVQPLFFGYSAMQNYSALLAFFYVLLFSKT